MRSASSFYVVTLVAANSDVEEQSRIFNTKRAATKWAKWLVEKCKAKRSTVWLGCAGGIRVVDFPAEAR